MYDNNFFIVSFLKSAAKLLKKTTTCHPYLELIFYICCMKLWNKVWHLYYDGFRNMTLGRTLWLIIAIKLFIMFFVLKLFFFPNYIKEHAQKGEEAEFVSKSLTP